MTFELLWSFFVVVFLTGSIISWIYLYRIYREDPNPPEPFGSWILRLLEQRALVDVIAIGILAFIYFRNNVLYLPRDPLFATIGGLAILAISTGPIHKALVVARQRRRYVWWK